MKLEPKSKYIKEQNIKGQYNISIFTALIFISFTLSGYTGQITNYVSFVLFGIWLFFAFISSTQAFMNIFRKKSILCFLIYIFVYFVLCMASTSIVNVFKYIGAEFVLFSPLIIYYYYYETRKYNIIKFLFISTVGIWLFFVIRALIFYAQNPNAARILASDLNYYNKIAIGGGYALAYGCTLFSIYLFDALINRQYKNNKIKLAAIISIILMIMVVLDTQSTITILALLFGLFVSVILKFVRNKDSKSGFNPKRILIYLSIALTTIILLLNMSNIGKFIMQISKNQDDIILIRLNEIGYKLAYGTHTSKTSDLDLRLLDLQKSFVAFLKSPIIGNGYKYSYDYSINKHYDIGNHCEWIDALSVNGIIGGLSFLLIYFFVIEEERRLHRIRISSAYIICLLLMGLLNPFKTFQSHYALFFLIPAFGYLISSDESKHNSIENQT